MGEFVDLLSLTLVNPSLSAVIAMLSCANAATLVSRINIVSLNVILKIAANVLTLGAVADFNRKCLFGEPNFQQHKSVFGKRNKTDCKYTIRALFSFIGRCSAQNIFSIATFLQVLGAVTREHLFVKI